MDLLLMTGAIVLGGGIGVIPAVILGRRRVAAIREATRDESRQTLEAARSEADRIIKSAIAESRDEMKKRRRAHEEELRKRKAEVSKQERRQSQREQALESKFAQIEQQKQTLEQLEQKLLQDEKKTLRAVATYELKVEEAQQKLKRVANMSTDEARRELMASLEADVRERSKQRIREIERETQEEAVQKAREIISLAIQRQAGEFVSDACVTVVNLPSDEMKGRIIGREGRNIRALEQSTGVDLIIDDTPEAVIISCFNPLKREIAKASLEMLIGDGRIHPARIAETVQRVESNFEATLVEIGEQAAFDVGLTDLHPELLRAIGQLKFTHVAGHSVLAHSLETANICGVLAAELDMDVKQAKRAGLLHDVGKARDHNYEGHHAVIGAEFLAKVGERAEIVEAVRHHHSEQDLFLSPLAAILEAANVLSANRPGVRLEMLATAIRRLEDMEQIVASFPGVGKAQVLQAGKEVRVLFSSDQGRDEDVVDLAQSIGARLRENLTFPGQIRITVSRSSQHVALAT